MSFKYFHLEKFIKMLSKIFLSMAEKSIEKLKYNFSLKHQQKKVILKMKLSFSKFYCIVDPAFEKFHFFY
jgi:hypothetical protein